ncbi:MAG: diguanylate cyclase [Spirochaetes bacterium]|nr:MAG: diguanylate cyclase [Spirochaetota bacterium]
MCVAVLISAALELFVFAYRPPRYAIPLGKELSIHRDGIPLGAGRIPFLDRLGSAKTVKCFVPGLYRYALSFSLPDTLVGERDLVLVFPQISGASLSPSVNGILLGRRGDEAEGRSTIWNAVHVFSLPSQILKADNALEIEIRGTYEAGITAVPYIASGRKAAGRIFALTFFSEYNIWISAGALLAISLIAIGIGWLGEGVRKGSLLLGFAGVCVAMFLLDFALIERLPISIALFKRIVVSLRHLGAALFILAYFSILGKKMDAFAHAFSGIHLACAVLLLAMPGGIVEIKRLYNLTYLTFLPLQVYLFVLVLRYAREDEAFRPIMFGVVVAVLCAIRDIVLLVLVDSPGSIMISHYGFVVLTLASSFYVVNDGLKHYRALVCERKRTVFFQEEAQRDPLTGSYNRKILPVLVQDLAKPFSVMIFDLDDFKSMNDEFGHATGDAILADVVRVAKANIRADDYVVRIGGDEFMVILRSCPLDVARTIAGRLIADCVKAAVPVVGPGSQGNLSYSVSIGIGHCGGEGAATSQDLKDIETEADRKMYKAKELGKGQWFG